MKRDTLKEQIDFTREMKLEGIAPPPLSHHRHQKLVAWAEKIMTTVGIVGQTLFYFQAYKIYSLRSATDVSAWGFSFAFVSLVCWLLYGIIIKNKVLIMVNTFAVIGAFLTLLAIFWVS
jgi:MtN3 and saliva related transmembrane protein